MHGDGDDTDEPKSISIAAERPVYNCLCMRSAPLKAMDDYHLLFSLRPSEQLFLLFLNQLHLIGIKSSYGDKSFFPLV
jgi:hypothetical protein